MTPCIIVLVLVLEYYTTCHSCATIFIYNPSYIYRSCKYTDKDKGRERERERGLKPAYNALSRYLLLVGWETDWPTDWLTDQEEIKDRGSSNCSSNSSRKLSISSQCQTMVWWRWFKAGRKLSSAHFSCWPCCCRRLFIQLFILFSLLSFLSHILSSIYPSIHLSYPSNQPTIYRIRLPYFSVLLV